MDKNVYHTINPNSFSDNIELGNKIEYYLFDYNEVLHLEDALFILSKRNYMDKTTISFKFRFNQVNKKAKKCDIDPGVKGRNVGNGKCGLLTRFANFL